MVVVEDYNEMHLNYACLAALKITVKRGREKMYELTQSIVQILHYLLVSLSLLLMRFQEDSMDCHIDSHRIRQEISSCSNDAQDTNNLQFK